MPITVKHEPGFDIVGNVALQTGYGMARQRREDIARQQSELAQKQAFQREMFERGRMAAIDAEKRKFRMGEAIDKRRFGYDLGRIEATEDYRMRLMEEQEKSRIKMERQQTEDAIYKNARMGINQGTMKLPDGVADQIKEFERKKKAAVERQKTATAQGKAALQPIIAGLDNDIRKAYMSAEPIAKHQRPWTYEEQVEWAQTSASNLPPDVDWEFDGKTGRPVLKKQSKTDVEYEKLRLEEAKLRVEALREGVATSEKQTVDVKRRQKVLQEAEQDMEAQEKKVDKLADAKEIAEFNVENMVNQAAKLESLISKYESQATWYSDGITDEEAKELEEAKTALAELKPNLSAEERKLEFLTSKIEREQSELKEMDKDYKEAFADRWRKGKPKKEEPKKKYSRAQEEADFMDSLRQEKELFGRKAKKPEYSYNEYARKYSNL